MWAGDSHSGLCFFHVGLALKGSQDHLGGSPLEHKLMCVGSNMNSPRRIGPDRM